MRQQAPESFYWLLVCADILDASAPDNWVAQQMLIATTSGLPCIDNHLPAAMALYAMGLAKALGAALGSRTTDPAYTWLATMVMAELARASQAQWSPEEMAEAAEVAVKVTTELLQVVRQ